MTILPIGGRQASRGGAVCLVALAFLVSGAAEAQQPTGGPKTLSTTTLGPTATPGTPPGGASGPVPPGTIPPGTLQSKPPYQSNIGLPYGQGVTAPYAYGAGRPGPGTPTPVEKPVAKGKTIGPAATEAEGAAAAAGAGTTGTEVAPVDPRLNLPRQTTSGPGNGQPPIKAAPDFKSGDPYARAAGSPALAAPFGVSPYKAPYSIDAAGNYYNPPGIFNQNGALTPNGSRVGTVDSQGQVFDRYGNKRGVLQR
ncbi:MAG: hypothetical protein IT563_18805 [Alphaproteobacteria bacterium]|nr:hypothetical protein [Alphaproteobacteria bacterium]